MKIGSANNHKAVPGSENFPVALVNYAKTVLCVKYQKMYTVPLSNPFLKAPLCQ